MKKPAAATRHLVVCIKNDGYPVSLEPRKIYVALSDPAAAQHGQLRVIDESGNDYLYPESFFVPITLPLPVRKAILTAA